MEAVTVSNVRKSFGSTEALSGVDLVVEEGETLGLLGPNGAGKTTLVRILATLLPPDSGEARIFGHDVTTEATVVRRMIGLTGQYAAVDEILTGRENLRLFGELFHLRSGEARRRADDLLERFDLTDAADRPARTYSGGMRRRLDLASSLLIHPELLFLDEPTTGLDPRSRNAIWEVARSLVDEGATLLLTTQYLEEADQLADRIAVIDHGHIIAEGTGDELKDSIGSRVVRVLLEHAEDRAAAIAAIRGAEPGAGETEVRVPVDGSDPLEALGAVTTGLRGARLTIRDVGLHRPTLDDVFLELTGDRPAHLDVAPDDDDADDRPPGELDALGREDPAGGSADHGDERTDEEMTA